MGIDARNEAAADVWHALDRVVLPHNSHMSSISEWSGGERIEPILPGDTYSASHVWFGQLDEFRLPFACILPSLAEVRLAAIFRRRPMGDVSQHLMPFARM